MPAERWSAAVAILNDVLGGFGREKFAELLRWWDGWRGSRQGNSYSGVQQSEIEVKLAIEVEEMIVGCVIYEVERVATYNEWERRRRSVLLRVVCL